MPTYTKDFIQQTIIHFKTKYHHDIDEDTAEEYLTALSNLFEAFTQLLEAQQTLDRETSQDTAQQD